MTRTLLVIALCASSAAAFCAPLEQTFQFDCDVPGGNASDWIGTIAPQLQQIRGSIELVEPRQHERWWPVASVFLMQGSQKIGLQLYRERKEQDLLRVAVLRSDSDGGRSVLTSVPWKDNPVAFSLSATESGDVELTVEGKVALLGIKSIEVERLSLSCSTAQFKFRDVVVRSEITQQSVAADRPEDAAPAEH